MPSDTKDLETRIESKDGQTPEQPERIACGCGKEIALGDGYEIVCPGCGNSYRKEIHLERGDKNILIIRLIRKGRAIDSPAKKEDLPQKGLTRLIKVIRDDKTNGQQRAIKVSENAQTFRCLCGEKTKLAESTIVTCAHCGQIYIKKLEAQKKCGSAWDTDRQIKKEYGLYPMNDIPMIVIQKNFKRRSISSSSGWHS